MQVQAFPNVAILLVCCYSDTCDRCAQLVGCTGSCKWVGDDTTAGSRLLSLVYQKYVVQLGWRIQLFPDCTVQPPEAGREGGAFDACLAMLQSLSLWLQVRLAP